METMSLPNLRPLKYIEVMYWSNQRPLNISKRWIIKLKTAKDMKQDLLKYWSNDPWNQRLPKILKWLKVMLHCFLNYRSPHCTVRREDSLDSRHMGSAVPLLTVKTLVSGIFGFNLDQKLLLTVHANFLFSASSFWAVKSRVSIFVKLNYFTKTRQNRRPFGWNFACSTIQKHAKIPFWIILWNEKGIGNLLRIIAKRKVNNFDLTEQKTGKIPIQIISRNIQ